MRKLEAGLLGIFAGAWAVAAFAAFGWLDLSGYINSTLRTYFAVAGGLGWLAGNVYRLRLRAYPLPRPTRALLALYLGGPPSLLLLWFALTPKELQTAIPVAPLLAMGVLLVFFLVPILVAWFWPRNA